MERVAELHFHPGEKMLVSRFFTKIIRIIVQHRRQERAKEQGQMEKKRRHMMQPTFKAFIHFKEWRRFTLCVLLYSAAGRRGNPMPDNLTLVSGQ